MTLVEIMCKLHSAHSDSQKCMYIILESHLALGTLNNRLFQSIDMLL